MGVFIQAPFWAPGYRYSIEPHATSVLVTPPAIEPLTRTQAKLRAGLDWVDGDPRDELIDQFLAAARAKVEQDTGLALLEQTRDVYLDAVSDYAITLPALSRPLKSITSVQTIDTAGATNTFGATNYVVDLYGGRIALAYGAAWPTDLRPFQPWVIRIVAGYASAAELLAAHPLLVHAVGLLVAHYATAGRDLTTAGTIITTTPQGYDEAIASYVPVELA